MYRKLKVGQAAWQTGCIQNKWSWRPQQGTLRRQMIQSPPFLFNQTEKGRGEETLRSASAMPLLIYTAAFPISHNQKSYKQSPSLRIDCLYGEGVFRSNSPYTKWQKVLDLHLPAADHKFMRLSIDLPQICSIMEQKRQLWSSIYRG